MVHHGTFFHWKGHGSLKIWGKRFGVYEILIHHMERGVLELGGGKPR
jgi:hypothetical protein